MSEKRDSKTMVLEAIKMLANGDVHKVITVKEVVKQSGISVPTVQKFVDFLALEGKISSTKLGSMKVIKIVGEVA